MPDIRLSICIPTYNMGPYIGQTLESMVSQLTDEVEIVVLDGASPDDTEQVVAGFSARYRNVRYQRNPERGGFDADTYEVIALSRGEYAWLFSADDVMVPGAVAAVLSRLSAGCDVLLCGAMRGTFDLEPVRQHPVSTLTHDEVIDLSDPVERRRYFEAALSTHAFWSFCSSVIVKRTSWDAAGPDRAFWGCLFAHVAQILRMIPNGLRLYYIPQPLLIKRAENDSFVDQGLAKRLSIAVDGYDRFATAFFPDPTSPEAMAIRRAVSNEFLAWVFIRAKLEARQSGSGDEALVDHLAELAYREPTWRNRINHLFYRATPLSAFVLAQRFNRRFVMRFRRVH